MTFNRNISGKNYSATDGEAFLYKYSSDGKFRGVSASVDLDTNKVVVTLTGWQVVSMKNNLMNQTVSGEWICIDDGWQPTGTDTLISASSAQKIVNKIIRCNAQIVQNNLVCARFANRLTSAQKKKLYDLQTRLNERNDALMSDGLVTEVQTSQPAGYAELQAYLQQFMQNPDNGIGIVITTTAVIVISCIVVASLATAAYFAYLAMSKEAEQDVQFSDELTRTLTAKLTPEEYQQLLQETKGLVTKTKLLDRIRTTGVWSILILVAVGIAGAAYIIKQAR